MKVILRQTGLNPSHFPQVQGWSRKVYGRGTFNPSLRCHEFHMTGEQYVAAVEDIGKALGQPGNKWVAHFVDDPTLADLTALLEKRGFEVKDRPILIIIEEIIEGSEAMSKEIAALEADLAIANDRLAKLKPKEPVIVLAETPAAPVADVAPTEPPPAAPTDTQRATKSPPRRRKLEPA